MIEYIIAGIFLVLFGWGSYKDNGKIDKKESVLLILGLLLIVNFNALTDAQFETLVMWLIIGAGVIKGIEAYQKIKNDGKD